MFRYVSWQVLQLQNSTSIKENNLYFYDGIRQQSQLQGKDFNIFVREMVSFLIKEYWTNFPIM